MTQTFKTVIFHLHVSAVCLLLASEQSKPLPSSALSIVYRPLEVHHLHSFNFFFSAIQYLERCVCIKKCTILPDVNPIYSKSPSLPSSQYLLFHLNTSFILHSWTFDRSCSMGVAGITLIPEEKEVLKDC